MKQLLYIAPVIIDLERLNGVSKKVLNQYKIFSGIYKSAMISYGPDCLYYFHDGIIETITLGKLNRRLKIYSFVNKKLAPNNYDYVYIRYHLCDFLFLNVLRLLRYNKSKIVIEIPTFPYKHELLKSKNGALRYLVDVTSNIFLRFYVSRIVTYSNDAVIFGMQTIKTMNGIIYKDVSQVQKTIYPANEINLISVSVTLNCHGYDRLIEGIKNYYRQGGNINIIYHLVGEGDEILKYKNLVAKYEIENHVVFYGFKGGQELDDVYQKADVAINSLGIHRIGLKTESTIKSKEYAAKGLPILSSYEIDAFSTNDNKKYVLKVSDDDTAINMDDLIEFYSKIYQSSSSNINEEIRNASQKRSDMEITLQGVTDYFNTEN